MHRTIDRQLHTGNNHRRGEEGRTEGTSRGEGGNMLCGCHCTAGVQVELRAEGQARCCLPPPPPHTHTTHTHAHTHTKSHALLGASCAGRLLGPAAVVHHTHRYHKHAHAHVHVAWRFTRCWCPLLSSTTTRPHRTHAHAHEAPRVAWRFVCGPPAGARCCLPPHTPVSQAHMLHTARC